MKGRYLFPALGSLDLKVGCYLRNTFRNSSKVNTNDDLEYSLKIFESGKVVYEHENAGVVTLSGFGSVRVSELVPGYDTKKNYLVVVDSYKGERSDFTYFPQEHHIYYENANGARASLLYDQQPAFPRKGNYSPVIVLAPKILLSEKVNTYIIFSAYREEMDREIQKDQPLEITILDNAGNQVAKYEEYIKLNSVFVFDARKHLQDKLSLGREMNFYNLVAKSGDAQYVIFAIIRNEESGNIAIEHSFPPGYYVSGDQKEIRKEALELGEAV